MWLSLWDRATDFQDLVITPTDPLQITEFSKNDDDGSIRLIVTPEKAASFRLHVSVIALKPGREMPSQAAGSVEFYYCLSGKGSFSQKGLHERATIQKGDSFTVDAGNIRWISNSAGSSDLVLLRACDGGSWYSRPDFDVIRVDPNRRSTMDYVSDGLQKVQNMAQQYVNKT